MPVENNGWNTDWNKPDDELTDSERAEIRRHTENAMWEARLARTRRSPAQVPRSFMEDIRRAQEQERLAEQKRIRERNQTRYLIAGIIILLAIVSLVGGIWLQSAVPTSQLASVLALIGVIGCIVAVPVTMLAVLLKE
jgi:anti-sigma factor RsiW